jgi:Peptidase of plants and bacteria
MRGNRLHIPIVLALIATGVLGAVESKTPEIKIVIDYAQTPELKDWVETRLRPTLETWYPKIVQSLPSEGYSAPKRFTVTFDKDMDCVAYTAGTKVVCAGRWFKQNLDGEAAGAVVHEMVHVVQQYHGRNPGWLVEGVADYIRWFKYEPADQRPRPDPKNAKYTDSYRTTAAFLEYVAANHDHEFVVKMNAAMREDRYTPDLWKVYTGKTVDELWSLYVQTLK